MDPDKLPQIGRVLSALESVAAEFGDQVIAWAATIRIPRRR